MKKTSVQIATELLTIVQAHEASWDGNTYTKGHWWTDNVEPFLNVESKHSAFAEALKVYHQWYNDIQHVCETTIHANLQ